MRNRRISPFHAGLLTLLVGAVLLLGFAILFAVTGGI